MLRPGWVGLALLMLLMGCQQRQSMSPEMDNTVPTRTVEHAMGTTAVPVAPERVIVLDYAPLDSALALGVEPIGRMAILPSSIYPSSVDTIPLVGSGVRPNLETILQLQPDLILSNRVSSGRIYRQLSQIAPTVLTSDNGRQGAWQANLRLYAEALGKPEQAEQLLADYQQRVEAVQAALPQAPEAIAVSIIAHWSGGIVAYSSESFPGSVLRDVGFTRNPAQGEGKRYGIRLSREDLTQIDGDVIFLLYNPESEDSVGKAAFVSDPLWSQLNAVQQGIVCEVDNANWSGGRSILAANQILVDVETCLTQAD
ncbi:MAG: iron-siderophore ABC transporter substrate-binding protein [Cyanobacteria bacterium P01_D01_bin.115]